MRYDMNMLDRFRRLAEIDILGGMDSDEAEEFESIRSALVGQGANENLLDSLWDAIYDEGIYGQIKGELR